MSQRVKVPFAIVPLMLGFGLLLTGVILLVIAFRPDLDSTAPGSISEFHGGMSSNHVATCSYDAVFTVDGRTYVADSLDASSSNCDLQIGDAVVVQYNSANPSRNQIQAGYFVWLGGALAAGGLLLLVLGVGLLVRSNRKGRR